MPTTYKTNNNHLRWLVFLQKSSYKIGKPLPAPHPDSIDRDEWDHYQNDAMNDKEMAVVMNALPTRVGNDVARISLPIMTAARTRDLAMKLQEGCPTPEAPVAAE